MRDRPILFSAPMVRAILDGRKTMTRRVVRHTPAMTANMMEGEEAAWCPYGGQGMKLWVRETWTRGSDYWTPHGNWKTGASAEIRYKADGRNQRECDRQQLGEWLRKSPERWYPSIFMPRWASRLTLEVVAVRVERLQDITEEDATAEGVWKYDSTVGRYYCMAERQGGVYRHSVSAYRELWDSINAKRGYGWAVNPWVWVVEFRREPA